MVKTRSGKLCVDHRINHDPNIRVENSKKVMTDPNGVVWDVPVAKSKPKLLPDTTRNIPSDEFTV